AAMLNTSDFSEGKYVIMDTKNGKIKRTSLEAYKNVRKNGLIAIGLDEGDEIASVVLTEGNAQLIIATENGMAIRIEEEKVRALSRSAHGVKAITLRDGDKVVSMALLREGAEVLTVTDKGFGRRSSLESYRIQNRGGFGLLNYKASEEKGKVCGVRVVSEDEDVIMISTDGIIIRIRVSDIRVMGRYATGVRLMRMSGDGTVAAFTSAEHDDTAETAKVEEPSDEEIAAAENEEQSEKIIEEPVPEDDDNGEE
ncbi:MAG: DNA gyrase subunit A, partial [Oscillospiraceae bacterium]|nr:DNA gyrase subunit A [Oscillospiraceae bacterium]